MFGSVQETVITDTGTSRTLQANLSKIYTDRLAFERQQLDSQQGISIATKQLLSEAAIHVNDYLNDASADFSAFDSNAEPVESDASVNDNVDEGSDICVPVTGDEQHAQMHASWRNQMLDLVEAFLQWKHNPANTCPDLIEDNHTMTAFQIATVDYVHVQSLLHSTYAGRVFGVPRTLPPNLPKEGIMCALHNSLRDQFAVTFDTYLEILRQVKCLVAQVLGQDTPHWRMLHACPACDYKQPDKPPLYPASLDSFDGNNSLKCVNSSGHADEHCFTSSYLITVDEVEKFKDDVCLCPATCPATAHVEPEEPSLNTFTPSLAIEASNDSSCTDNWKVLETCLEG
ncbi:hypothetical protein BDR04DRAFT_1146733 [Suillus decipiens]|nr:hypothetical protein BDR04DRAFT_1146733 [Suillus decipiens]